MNFPSTSRNYFVQKFTIFRPDNHKLQLSIEIDIKMQITDANLRQNTVDNRNLAVKYIFQLKFGIIIQF